MTASTASSDTLATELHDYPFVDGEVTIRLHSFPRDGRVAYTVWPCSTFLVDALVGWRVLELVTNNRLRPFSSDLTTLQETLNSKWFSLSPSARSHIARRCGKSLNSLFSDVEVLELGSGTGVVGFALHRLGCRSAVLTDSDKCMQLLEINLEEWKKERWVDPSRPLTIQPFSWEQFDVYRPLHRQLAQPLPPSLGAQSHSKDEQEQEDALSLAPAVESPVSWLILCDCIYQTLHIGKSPLLPIIQAFLTDDDSKAHERKMVLIAYESRDKDIEDSFWYQVQQDATLDVVLVSTCNATPSEGNELEETTYSVYCVLRK